MNQNLYNLRKRSPIESYRNHIPCGNKSCRKSCDQDSLQCKICLKFVHYKCQDLTKKYYLFIINNGLNYICNGSCYGSFLPFFEVENSVFSDTIIFDNDTVTEIVDKPEYPCKKCNTLCLQILYFKQGIL